MLSVYHLFMRWYMERMVKVGTLHLFCPDGKLTTFDIITEAPDIDNADLTAFSYKYRILVSVKDEIETL